ncbi:MAG: ATP-binding protein [Actinomycetota bacterium]|nr:ATP-binding protein [Actinomycetota bacterium]
MAIPAWRVLPGAPGRLGGDALSGPPARRHQLARTLLPERFERQSAAVPEVVPAIRRNLSAYAGALGARPGLVDAVALAASEAMTSSIRHAYTRQLPGPLRVAAYAEGGQLVVIVEDEGARAPAREVDEDDGYGLAIISKLADELAIDEWADRPGTRVTMRFRL